MKILQRSFYFLFLLAISNIAYSQNKAGIEIKNSSFISGQENLPFWLTVNKNGIINNGQSPINLSELVAHNHGQVLNSKLDYQLGLHGVAAVSSNSYLQLNRAYAGLGLWNWKIDAGLFSDPENYGGLSTSNGNMARSLNARPYPKIRLSTNGYLGFPFVKKWFQFKAEYDEGWLNDDRYVKDARLHHKSLYGQLTPARGWKVSLGLEHFVMWGGTSPNPSYGKLPTDTHSYLLYILAAKGDDAFPETDRINVAGNQLGTYQFQVSRETANWLAAFYISHPFEDYSGIALRNYPDNLIGIHWETKSSKSFLSSVVYEFINTRQQSLKDSFYVWVEKEQRWKQNETDNYFSHGVYRSGFTYQKRMIGSPLFKPDFNEDGSLKLISNRFFAHHIGAKGNLNSVTEWKTMLTYSQHLGTFWKPYTEKQDEFSLLVEFIYSGQRLPFVVNTGIAADFGSHTESNFGLQLSISKQF